MPLIVALFIQLLRQFGLRLHSAADTAIGRLPKPETGKNRNAHARRRYTMQLKEEQPTGTNNICN